MEIATQDLNIAAGVYKEGSQRKAKGRWFDANLVRFQDGAPEQIGGWQELTTTTATPLQGATRRLHAFKTLEEKDYFAAGTSEKFYVWSDGALADITPTISTAIITSVINTSIDSNIVTISVVAHGLVVGDHVTFCSASTVVGGVILCPEVSVTVNYKVVSVPGANSFQVSTPTTATATSAGGGSTFTYRRLYPSGGASESNLFGWGAGPWSGGSWGVPISSNSFSKLRLWSIDSWGEDIIGNIRGGPLMIWDATTPMAAASVITVAPSNINKMIVSPENRQVIICGCSDESNNYDPLLVRWSSRENYLDWAASATNTAGSQRLGGRGTVIQSAARSRNQILIWTESDLFSMQFIGPPFIFGFNQLGVQCGLYAINSHVELNDVTYWMGTNSFYMYDGQVRQLNSDVESYVFGRLNRTQRQKVHAGTNAEFSEIIWFYPSSTSDEIDSYALYNTQDASWSIGSLNRTSWLDRGLFNYPLAVDYIEDNSKFYFHELGTTANGAPINSWVESGDIELDSGDSFILVDRLIPDFTDVNGEPLKDNLNLYLYRKNYPGNDYTAKGPYVVSAHTGKISTRIRGRALALRIESNSDNNAWRYSSMRADIRPSGKR